MVRSVLCSCREPGLKFQGILASLSTKHICVKHSYRQAGRQAGRQAKQSICIKENLGEGNEDKY